MGHAKVAILAGGHEGRVAAGLTVTLGNTAFLCSLDEFAARALPGFPRVGASDGSMTERAQDASRLVVAGGAAPATN